ncbi:MAG: anhydro-N-acetylmuramic acid kinase [Saprospiraceae bacterium]|nr:anhydro-N-acetylmuramic acid kinase [Saprospiraceae bacterium]
MVEVQMDGLDIAFLYLRRNWRQIVRSVLITQVVSLLMTSGYINYERLTTILEAKLLLTHTAFGKWMGDKIQQFIEENQLQHKVHFIASHGHTVFHEPAQSMTYQIGDGAHIAAITQLPVITDLRNMDIALGGQGAPIVPIAESKL